MRAALIRDDVVENVVLIGEGYTPPDDLEVVELTDDEVVGPGWLRDGSGWSAPDVPEAPPPAPTTEELSQRLDVQQRIIDALVLGGIDDADTGLDEVLLDELPDSGGSLDDLDGLDLGALPDSGESLDDLDAFLPNGV